MHTDTPHSPGAPSITSARRSIREAIRAIDSRWRTAPSDLSPGDVRDRLLEPLFTCAGRVAEPGAIAHMHGVGTIAEAIALAAGWTQEDAGELRIHAALHDVGKVGALRLSVDGGPEEVMAEYNDAWRSNIPAGDYTETLSITMPLSWNVKPDTYSGVWEATIVGS